MNPKKDNTKSIEISKQKSNQQPEPTIKLFKGKPGKGQLVASCKNGKITFNR